MSQEIKHYCDVCKREIGKYNRTPDKFFTIKIEAIQHSVPYNNQNKQLDLCEVCAEKVGFTITEKELSREEDITIQDKLYNIVVEILQSIPH